MSNDTENNSPRNLVDVCDKEDFRVIVKGGQYCRLGISKQIECPRQSKTQDTNGFYPCLDIRDDYEGFLDQNVTLN